MRVRIVGAVLAGVALLWPAMGLGQSGLFRAAFRTDTGSGQPTAVATGDVDGDDLIDVVFTSSNEGAVGVLNGLGTGEVFVDPFPIPVGSFPSALVRQDFDEDGVEDLVVANDQADSVVFLKGLRSPEYFAPGGNPVDVGPAPRGLAAGYLDADEHLDVVVANEGRSETLPGSVTILHGDGQGNFTVVPQPNPDKPDDPLTALPAELVTRAVAVGKLDGDDYPDILAVNTRSNSMTLFLGNGDGTFAAGVNLAAGPSPEAIGLAQLNADQDLDVVVANGTEDAVSVMLNNGDGTFAPRRAFAVGDTPTALVIGHLNGDARPDVVVANNRSQDVSVLLGDGQGGFAPARTFVAGAGPVALALGLMDGDDLLDVVSAHSVEAGSMAVLRNRGDGSLFAVEDIPVNDGPEAVAAADIDDDGFADLIVATSQGHLAVFGGAADGRLTERESLPLGGAIRSVVARDLNRDTRVDLVAADSEGERVLVLRNLGRGRFSALTALPTGRCLDGTTPCTAATQAASCGAQALTQCFIPSGSSTGHCADGTTRCTSETEATDCSGQTLAKCFAKPQAVAAGDFNGDGRMDVAASIAGVSNDAGDVLPGRVAVFLQQATGTYGPARHTVVENAPLVVAAANFDCDVQRRDDLAVANQGSDSVSVMRSNGDGTFTLSQRLSASQVGQQPLSLAVGDFDRDGKPDLAVSNTGTSGSSLRVLLGMCDGTFTPKGSGVLGGGSIVRALVARDFTGDQIVDLGVVNEADNTMRVLRGVGNGEFSLFASFGQVDGVSTRPIALAGADLDGDGRYDAATGNKFSTSNNLSVLLNCARDPGCAAQVPGAAAVRGDANGDGLRTAADLISAAREVMDGDGFHVEDIARGSEQAEPGVDANGDGYVNGQDRTAVMRWIFRGA